MPAHGTPPLRYAIVRDRRLFFPFMARLPLVAIIGRPNTGKSTLFNRMIGERKSIESEVAGTTRDHVAHRVETDDLEYLLVDTGGMGGGTDDEDFEKDVHGQSILAIENADVIIFTVNAREEFTKNDYEIASILRRRKRSHVPVILVPTKCDNEQMAEDAEAGCLELGLGDEVFPVSAFHGHGIDAVERTIVSHLTNAHFKKTKEKGSDDIIKIAIVGKPNVGKSSLMNALMSDEQRKTSPRLVSDIPGTTRDSADTLIKHEGTPYLFIDTAGLKRNAKTEEGIEEYSMLRSVRAIEECDVALLLLDGDESVSKQDKRIADLVIESGKGLLVLVNKADLLDAEVKKEKLLEVRSQLLFARFAPILFGSAKTRDGILKIFQHLRGIAENRKRRIAIKDLRNWYLHCIQDQPMKSLQTGKHITQADELPPTFILFVRDPKKVTIAQLRFLENRLRETFGFEGTPIRFITKAKSKE